MAVDPVVFVFCDMSLGELLERSGFNAIIAPLPQIVSNRSD